MATLEGGTFADLGTQEIGTWADGGRVTVTFADLGGESSAELANCAACVESGGQANQIKVTFQAPAGNPDGGTDDPPVDTGDGASCNAQLCTEEEQASSGCWCDTVCDQAGGDADELADLECCTNYVDACGGD